MAKKSPMSLSLEYLNKLGWTCHITEKWNAFGKVRQDAFGFGDILGYHGRHGVALIQTTSWDNFTARRNKILDSPHRAGWRNSGGKILLHAWGKKGLREEWL